MTANTSQNLLRIETRHPDRATLVQITDCHLFASGESDLQGVNTRATFDAVCAAITERHGELDALVATGDLSQDASAESYAYAAASFERLGPGFWIPGNHDESALMAQHLTGTNLSDEKRFILANWLVVLLDSTVPGEVYGRVSDEQIAFLRDSAALVPDLNLLVCLHHQAHPIGSRWIDDKGLKESERFRAELKTFPTLRGVTWGHVHQQWQQRIDGVEWMSTPSSCAQFKPGAEEFALDSLAPGYRTITLHADGRLDSQVERLK